MGSINSLIRKNVAEMKPYSSARDEFSGQAAVFLDANENPYFEPLNRYPDPMQISLKQIITKIKPVQIENIFLGNGSDEAIDILIRAFCEPGIHNILAFEPTYGMYKVCAAINNIEYRQVPMGNDFEFEPDRLLNLADNHSRIIFLCSPNNPSGNSISAKKLDYLLDRFNGIIVVDEAYIDFSSQSGFVEKIDDYERLVILQTLSKAWGRAGIRLGMAFAGNQIISVMNKIKPPYNINSLTINEAIATLNEQSSRLSTIKEIVKQRDFLFAQLSKLDFIEKVYPSDANFLLLKVKNATTIYNYLAEKNIIIRNRSGIAGCDSCLRITVGTAAENIKLIEELNNYV